MLLGAITRKIAKRNENMDVIRGDENAPFEGSTMDHLKGQGIWIMQPSEIL